MNKKGVRRTLCAVLAMVLLAMSVPALAVSGSSTLAKKGDWYYVIATRLNVRSGPGIQYKVRTVLKRGTKVMFHSVNRGWWAVYYDYYKGG